MGLHPLAGRPAPKSMLINVPRLIAAYYRERPDPTISTQRVAFGTSGHRGSAFDRAFNEQHILAITQAIVEYRKTNNIDGPLFMGIDSHALSEPALETALDVLAANNVTTMIDKDRRYTPTPVISHAILTYNLGRSSGLADGIVITPSHNPPEDGGFKYNPPNGGPADTNITSVVEKRANELLRENVPRARWENSATILRHDYIKAFVEDLANVIDLQTIRDAKIKVGVDPLGGSNLYFWAPIAERYDLDLTVVNDDIDPRFAFMPVDKDGKIRMDCSSPQAMASLINLKDRFDIAFGNDTDSDRHGIVTQSVGLMNPNHYLAVAIDYLFSERKSWKPATAIGKTLVSSSMIDRVAKKLGRRLVEVPVGFKWFVGGLCDGSLGFGGEESAGASFLRKSGAVWTTDKDGIILDLLAAEILAKTSKDPGEHYRALTRELGDPVYERIDAAASPEEKEILKKLSAERVKASELAGETIRSKLVKAPGNDAAIGGLKVVTDNGWFAARPSGTENVYKIYAESFKGRDHLARIQEEARAIVTAALKGT